MNLSSVCKKNVLLLYTVCQKPIPVSFLWLYSFCLFNPLQGLKEKKPDYIKADSIFFFF